MDTSGRRRRKPKPPLAAWIVAQREIHGWKSEELARRLEVADSTVRGWESGRSVSLDSIDRMERLFGVEAPGHGEETGDLAAAIVMLVGELTALREERQSLAAKVAELELVVRLLYERELAGSPEHQSQPETAG